MQSSFKAKRRKIEVSKDKSDLEACVKEFKATLEDYIVEGNQREDYLEYAALTNTIDRYARTLREISLVEFGDRYIAIAIEIAKIAAKYDKKQGAYAFAGLAQQMLKHSRFQDIEKAKELINCACELYPESVAGDMVFDTLEKIKKLPAEEKIVSQSSLSMKSIFKKAVLDLCPEFCNFLFFGKIKLVSLSLKKYPALATHTEKDDLPPVIAALDHTYHHANGSKILDLLAEYKADFNCVSPPIRSYSKQIDFDLNPLAWLLLNGGDSTLIKKLIDCGTDQNHASIDKIIKIVTANKSEEYFNYTPYREGNPNHCSPLQLIEIYKKDFSSSNVVEYDCHASRTPRELL